MGDVTRRQWAQEIFGGAAFGDRRWANRAALMCARAALNPSGRVSEVFTDPAERQGAYGLLECSEINPVQVAGPVFCASARRCAGEPFVYLPTDGSSLTLTDLDDAKGFGSIGSRRSGGLGLKVISTLALTPEGVPVGLTAQQWWARSRSRASKHRDSRSPRQKETQHWLDAVQHSRKLLHEHAPKTRCWFQLDREGDAWPLLKELSSEGDWFTIRGNHNRRIKLDAGDTHLRPHLNRQPILGDYKLEIRPGHNRKPRTAQMALRACDITLDIRDKKTGRRSPLTVNVVLAREQRTTPAGEKPVEWLLLTNRPITTLEHVHEVVLGYAQRWKIEEFHRTWKSGSCRVEETQLRSANAVIKWATLLAAVATRIERLKHLARKEPERPATDEFSPVELRAITLLRFGKKAKEAVPTGKVPTIAEATLWVAQLGGYTGRSSGGPPGAITLARGLKSVRAAAQALEALQPDL